MIDVPYHDEPPAVASGDRVECRDAGGMWWPKVAMSTPRYDRRRAVGGKCYLTVAVANVAEWRTVGAAATWVNWPAEAVRKVAAQTAGKGQG